MSDDKDPISQPEKDRIDEIVEAIHEVSPANLDSEISARCGGDRNLEEAVRSILETRQGRQDHPPSSSEIDEPQSVDDQAPTGAHGDFMADTLDLEVQSEDSKGGGLGETIDLPLGDPVKGGSPVPPELEAQFSHMPKTIAEFSVEKLLGSGGMGSVYLARQQHPDREVAVKVMKVGFQGAAAMQRFEFEIETLARLVHPAIAELYEAGIHHSSEGDMPYVAMEYVLGARPITSYAKDIGLDLKDRLRLFRKACDGVGFGHARGVIHRDLKPPNILVDEDGDPKIIDFGVARAAEGDDTLSGGQVVGTLRYMSPEQAAASRDIDTSTDVYSLGLILYEMLSQRSPYVVRASTLTQAKQIIEQAEVPLLSKACPEKPEYAGDLEMICAKALEKDPSKRYRSANELSDDIQRYIDDEPVIARPPSTMETLRRISRKQKPLVAMIGVTIAVVIGALIAVSIFAVRANLARKEAEFQEGVARTALVQAETERARLERLALVQGRMLVSLDAAGMGRTLEGKIISSLTDAMAADGVDPEVIEKTLAVQRDLMSTFGPIDVSVAIIVKHMLEPMYRDLELLLSEDPLTDADIRELLGELNEELGRNKEAEVLLKKALEIRLAAQGPESKDTLRTKSNLASLLFVQGKNEESKTVFEEVLETSVAVGGWDDPLALQTLQNLGAVMAVLGRNDDAEQYLTKAYEGLKSTKPADAWKIQGNLGILKLQNGDSNSARELLAEAYSNVVELHGTESVEAAEMALNYAEVFRVMGDTQKSLELVTQASNSFEKNLGQSHPFSLKSTLSRGSLLMMQGDFPSAERDLRNVWIQRGSMQGRNDPGTLEALNQYSMAVAAQEKYEEAIPLIQEFVEVSRKVYGKKDGRRTSALLNLGVSYYQVGRLEDSESPLLELIEICSGRTEPIEQPCEVAAPILLTVYNQLAKQHPESDWPEKARLHKESF